MTLADGDVHQPCRVTVIGCGLIGGSLALASQRLAAVGEVAVVDADPAVRELAGQRGLRVARSVREGVADADLVMVATPVESVNETATEAGRWMGSHAVLTDVGSVKAGIVDRLGETPAGSRDFSFRRRFIGGHPMTGSERQGLEGADPTLFQGATYVLTPNASTSPDALDVLSRHVRGLGARVLTIDAGHHDRLVAAVSHLPQLVSSVLMAHAASLGRDDPGLFHLAGGGFRDVTRVAGSNPELWSGILRENRDAVLDAVDGLLARLGEARDAIATERWEKVYGLLEAGRRGRGLLPRKDVPVAVVDLVVPIADAPGRLAAVTTTLGTAGVNIEDVSMRHVEEGGRGVLVVAVGQPDADRALAALDERGFACHIETR